MDYVIARTHVIDHERFLDAGPHARDLWTWGMLYAGAHETDGELPMSAVLASPWGYGGRANIRLATKLVEVGLWERTERGFRVCRWAEQGNKTRAQLEEAREAARKKKAAQRSRFSKKPDENENCPPGTEGGTPQGSPEDVLNSPSYSLSGSDLSGRSDLPARSPSPPEPASVAPPSWAAPAVDAVEMATGERIDLGTAWAKYQATRERDRRAPSAPDFRAFLASWANRQKSDRVNQRARGRPERQPLGNPNAAWLKTGSDL